MRLQVSQPMAAPGPHSSSSGRGLQQWSANNFPAGSSFGRHPLGTSPYGHSVDMVDLVERLMDRETPDLLLGWLCPLPAPVSLTGSTGPAQGTQGSCVRRPGAPCSGGCEGCWGASHACVGGCAGQGRVAMQLLGRAWALPAGKGVQGVLG